MSILFPGRLGLAEARIPHIDRHGLVYLSRGNLYVRDGTLTFRAAGSPELEPGEYAVPYQAVSMILLGPGTSVTHDVLRIMARHGTLLAAVGEGGVKYYTAPPMGTGRSATARAHARLWADPEERAKIVRRMYGYRFQAAFPNEDIAVLRGMEGARVKAQYQVLAKQYGIKWKGRKYDRQNPGLNDAPNQAINHAATFVEAAAEIAVAAVGALPPLGFIHEDSSNAFVLDIADLWRAEITLPLAFSVVAKGVEPGALEKHIRYEAARWFRKHKLIPRMIDRIKELLYVTDSGSDP
ncbi:MAG TPA: type I-E CRISPR-associated endonuclease Cas1e [Limnochordia bacterium]|nr:type I-E CRISPR-associated endonuclease Cas1e [Limnochordia bacterium]